MNRVKVYRTPVDEMVIQEGRVLLTVAFTTFQFDESYIDEVLAEGYNESETLFHEIDGIILELTMKDFRHMKTCLTPIGGM